MNNNMFKFPIGYDDTETDIHSKIYKDASVEQIWGELVHASLSCNKV